MRTTALVTLLVAWAWTAPAPTAPARVLRVPTPDLGIQPQLAVDDRGELHLLYFKGAPAGGDLFYTRLRSDGRPSRTLRVNSHAGSAVATGTMRGGELAIGKDGRVHVAWYGSATAQPRVGAKTTPILYTRMNPAGTAFEPERNVAPGGYGIDGVSVAADRAGHVYVAWHAGVPTMKSEAERRLWVTRSDDGGGAFAAPVSASAPAIGGCGCCGVRAMADRQGALYVLFRSAGRVDARDAFLVASRDAGRTFASHQLEAWNVGACPMSSFALADGATGVLAAWETAGEVKWATVDAASGVRRDPSVAPGGTGHRKHPVIAENGAGDVLLAWTDGTGWNQGGSFGWQVFDRAGRPTVERGKTPGVRVWSLVAVAPRPDGGFLLVY